jgi:TctA family transporter
LFDNIHVALFSLASQPQQWLAMLAATLLGLVFGIIPGLGGKLAIALLIPAAILLEPETGLLFLISMHAVVHTGGSVPSILLGVPGSGPDAATVVDGHPLALRGHGGRALGASLMASAVGGIIGALFLAATLPLLKPILLAIGPPEFFLLAMLGITTVAAVSGTSLRKGIIVALFGLALTCIGLSPHTGDERYTFGQLFLWDGIDFVTAILAIFVVPEMVELGRSGIRQVSAEPGSSTYQAREVWRGVRDVFTHRWLSLRTSIIGAFVGMIPGLGGDVAAWVSYGHAVQSSPDPSRFGKGAIEGVIAPETANNAKEGGALLPTLAFGIPGSSGMAVLLGAFVVLGIQPGPAVLIEQQQLVTKMFLALVLANVMGALILLFAARQLIKIASLPAGLIVPLVLSLVVIGSYMNSQNWQYLPILLLLGLLGCGLKRWGWPRPPFAIGLALGHVAENSLQQSLAIWGPGFLLRPPSLVLLGLILASVGIYYWRRANDNG